MAYIDASNENFGFYLQLMLRDFCQPAGIYGVRALQLRSVVVVEPIERKFVRFLFVVLLAQWGPNQCFDHCNFPVTITRTSTMPKMLKGYINKIVISHY
jgi:hypothetical protein